MRNTLQITPLVIVLAWGFSWTAIAQAQVAEPKKPAFDPHYVATANGKATFMDPQVSCYSCHRATDPNQADMYRERGTLKRVTLVETARWEDLDFHSQATHALTTPRAKAMSDLLGYDVTKSTQCLNCHSGHHKIGDAAGAPPKPGETSTQAPTLVAPREALLKHGVSCQACHGPASKWDTAHRGANEEDIDWWKKSSDEKYAFGLLDVRHPRTRSQVCLSCHLGSSSEGKILTHEMYAAGHPPLGNFELETFVAGMPYHGVLIEDKAKQEPGSHKDWYRKDDFYRTRCVLTSSIVALRMQVQLVLDEAAWSLAAAKEVAAADVHRARWPELAHFNCASCHHELAADRRAPDRSAAAPPGRPMLRSWPTALYEAVLIGSGNNLSLEPLLKPLETALARNPFGRAKEVRDAAQVVAARLDQELTSFESRPLDQAGALRYLEAITTVGLSRPVDYEEARQLAWGAKTIVAELKAQSQSEGKTPAPAGMDKIEAAVAAFDADLTMPFPKKPQRPAGTLATDPKVYSPSLLAAGSKSLEGAIGFDEAAFRRRLESLKSALSSK